VKLQDPRAKIRKKSLLEILNSWEKIKYGENFEASSYVHRIIYCLIDRNPEVRRVACEILHSVIFYFIPIHIFSNGLWHKDCIIRTIQDIEFTLLGYLNSDYYLIDKKLKRTILQNGLKNVKLCGNCQCFSLDEPCKSGLEKSPIEGDHSSYSSHEQAEQSFVYINSKKIVGICGVCHLSINEFEELRTCPLCHSMAHREHLLEWVKIKGKCPSCNSNLKEIEIIDETIFSIGAL
jgi:uncharacterized CHY-type Zn-finger protein